MCLKMCRKSVCLLLQVILSAYCNGLDIFHTGSKVTFYPEAPAEYFGYSVLLTSSSLTVGAPKASTVIQGSPISPGLVFTCPVNNLDVANTTCRTFKDNARISSGVSEYIKDDMWLGASIASIHGDVLICAPRWTLPYKDTHMLSNGICFVQTKARGQVVLKPLSERNRQAFLTTGTRKEYGEYGTHLNFYAYGQVGISVKVTSNNSVIIGAPGLLQWTGGVVDYKLSPGTSWAFFSRQPVTNPYYTKELGPDDYFGYSVESGIFESLGSVLYVAAAPRSKMGYGQVLIFEPPRREVEALIIHATVQGPQLGSYFGASLACVDVNGDGRVDLLVGAPNYVAGDDLPFDQGAVFVYLNREVTDKAGAKSFRLEEASQVTGSGKHGARFGTAMADLGDVDGDGFRDIAIGAPWESGGSGAVYIYRGSKRGLQTSHSQRITAEGRGFGMAIASGLDLDGNKCNDLAVGAYASGSAYVFRCVPSLTVTASINVPDAMDLPQNATNFTVLFCVETDANKLWPTVRKHLKASIIVDSENQRAILSGDDEYTVIAEPGLKSCEQQVVEVKPTADLSKPISLKFVLEPNNTMTDDSLTFDRASARFSDDCKMESSFKIQLTRDCGEDLICRPLLNMSLSALDSSLYVPGTQSKLGVRVTITNIDEPAYGAKVYIVLPVLPIRVPTPCTLKELKLTCTVPSPLPRGAKVEWDVELEYTQNTTEETELIIVGILEDPFQSVINNTVMINVKPMASFNISGQSLPNVTVPVTRQKLYERGFVTITHYYEIINDGPSDWPELEAAYYLPEMLSVTHLMKGCTANATRLLCTYSAPANESLSFVLTLRFDLADYGVLLEESLVVNFTTSLTLPRQNQTKEIMTSLVLDPAPSLWPLIIGLTVGIILAIGLLAAIVYGLHKNGFFSRRDREKLKLLQDEATSEGPSEGPSGDPCGSTATMQLVETDESSQELLLEDSD